MREVRISSLVVVPPLECIGDALDICSEITIKFILGQCLLGQGRQAVKNIGGVTVLMMQLGVVKSQSNENLPDHSCWTHPTHQGHDG